MINLMKTSTVFLLGVTALVLIAVAGCSGGKSPTFPNNNQGSTDARVALMSFADACSAQDVQSASALLNDPASDRPFIELIRDILPTFGTALKDSTAENLDPDSVEFHYQLSDPSGDAIPAFIFCIKTDSGWRVSFDSPSIKIEPQARTSQWQTTTHYPILTNYIIEYYLAHYPQDTEFMAMLGGDSDFADEIGYGSFSEDTDGLFDGIDRTGAHFMAPKNQNGIPTSPDQFSPLMDQGIASSPILPGVNSLDWALGNHPQQTNKGSLTNDFTFPLAVKWYMDAQALTGDAKTLALKNAFNKFGHVLHLMEDMTCPAHTRDDQHNILTSDNDPFEDWAAIYNLPLMVQVPILYDDSIAGLPAVQRDMTGFPSNSLLQNFFNLAKTSSGGGNYRAYSGVSALFWYTSWMSNHLCYSEDTIYQSTVPSAVDTSDFPKLTRYSSTGLNFYGTPGPTALQSLQSLGIVSSVTNEYLVGTGTAKCYPWMLWYYFKNWNWPSIGTVISAEESGQGLITVADTRDVALSGVREQQFKIQFPLCVLSGSALLHEYYLKAVKGM